MNGIEDFLKKYIKPAPDFVDVPLSSTFEDPEPERLYHDYRGTTGDRITGCIGCTGCAFVLIIGFVFALGLSCNLFK